MVSLLNCGNVLVRRFNHSFADCEYLSEECKEKYLITPLISEWWGVYLSCLLIICVTAKDHTSANVNSSRNGLVNIKREVNTKLKNKTSAEQLKSMHVFNVLTRSQDFIVLFCLTRHSKVIRFFCPMDIWFLPCRISAISRCLDHWACRFRSNTAEAWTLLSLSSEVLLFAWILALPSLLWTSWALLLCHEEMSRCLLPPRSPVTCRDPQP